MEQFKEYRAKEESVFGGELCDFNDLVDRYEGNTRRINLCINKAPQVINEATLVGHYDA
jgi:hypothetical protein